MRARRDDDDDEFEDDYERNRPRPRRRSADPKAEYVTPLSPYMAKKMGVPFGRDRESEPKSFWSWFLPSIVLALCTPSWYHDHVIREARRENQRRLEREEDIARERERERRAERRRYRR